MSALHELNKPVVHPVDKQENMPCLVTNMLVSKMNMRHLPPADSALLLLCGSVSCKSESWVVWADCLHLNMDGSTLMPVPNPIFAFGGGGGLPLGEDDSRTFLCSELLQVMLDGIPPRERSKLKLSQCNQQLRNVCVICANLDLSTVFAIHTNL